MAGNLAPELFERLATDGIEVRGPVVVAMEFERVETLGSTARGHAAVTVRAECQRCLGPVECVIEATSRLLLVPAGWSGSVPEDYEQFEVGSEPIDLVALIEDELILALPMVFRHDTAACAGVETEAGAPAAAQRRTAFAALKHWKALRRNE